MPLHELLERPPSPLHYPSQYRNLVLNHPSGQDSLNQMFSPGINVKNVAKYFPKSKETQKGHIHGERQGVRSTKVAELTEDLTTTLPQQK